MKLEDKLEYYLENMDNDAEICIEVDGEEFEVTDIERDGNKIVLMCD